MTDTQIEEDSLALKILADEINRTQDRLINLQASYAKLGGIFDGDEDGAKPAKQKLLAGPKPKKKKKKGNRKAAPPAGRGTKVSFTLNGQSIEMSSRLRDVLEILQAAAGVPVAKRDLVACFAGPTPNWNQTQAKLNEFLKPAAVRIVNVHGQGWKLEKL